jgi:hypothetical protein
MDICDRCGGKRTTGWCGALASGTIKVNDDCCLPDHLLGGMMVGDTSFMDKPPVVKWRYQEMELRWGDNYKICLDCHHKLLALIGGFFFKPVPAIKAKIG